jgi:hypothetical protein
VQREGFQIPFVEPPLLSPLEFGFGGSPIYSMSATCPTGFYPPDCDTVEAAFKYKPQRKIGGGKSSSSMVPTPSTSTAKPLTRAPVAAPSPLAGASSSGPVHNSAAHRIPYVLVPDRKTVYAEDKNSTAPKRKKMDTSQGEDSDSPVVVDRVRFRIIKSDLSRFKTLASPPTSTILSPSMPVFSRRLSSRSRSLR